MAEWNKNTDGVSILYENNLVQIKTDKELMDYLDKPGNGSVALSGQIHQEYLRLFGRPLDITKDSMAVEILIHAYADSFTRRIEKCSAVLPGSIYQKLKACLKHLQVHTEIIDCGERSVDSNRFIFDGLAPYHTILYTLLGRKA